MKKFLNIILICLFNFLQIHGAASEVCPAKSLEEISVEKCNQLLFNAISEGDVRSVENFLSLPATILEKFINLTKEDCTPLVLACAFDKREIIEKLLMTEAIDVNARVCSGLTALMVAAYGSNIEAVRLLLADRRQDVTAVEACGDSALTFAVVGSHNAEIVRLLLADHRMNSDCINHKKVGPMLDGATMFMGAAWNGDDQIIKEFVADGRADLNITDEFHGDTALMKAAYKGRLAVVRTLLAAGGVDIDLRDREGKTALKMAEEEGHADVAQLLRQAER